MRSVKLFGTAWIVLAIALVGLIIFAQPAHAPEATPAQHDAPLSVALAIQDTLPLSTITIRDGASVLDLTRDASQHTNFRLGTKEYPGMGTLVEQIGEHVNGDSGKYWLFYVNGTLSQVGAADYILKSSDQIEWKFEMPTEE